MLCPLKMFRISVIRIAIIVLYKLAIKSSVKWQTLRPLVAIN